MRSTLVGYGFLAALGLLSASVVHGQVQQAVDTTSNRSRSVTTIGVDIRDEPVLLAGAADPFSAARKAQGMNLSAPSNTSSSDSASTSGSDSSPSSSDNRQTAPRLSNIIGARSNTADNSSQSSPSTAFVNDNSSESTGSGPLQNLQQRLSAVRKSTTIVSPTPATSMPNSDPSASSPAMDLSLPAADFPTESTKAGRSSMTVVSETGSTSDSAQTSAPSVMASSSGSASSVPTLAPSPSTTASTTESSNNDYQPSFNPRLPTESRRANSAAKSSSPVVSSPIAQGTPVVSEPISALRRNMAIAPASSGSTAQSSTARASSDGVLFAHQSPVLEVETTGPKSISVGKEANYCVTIVNNGELAAQNVEVTVKTPEWSEVLRTKATNGETVGASSKRGEPLVWRLPRLEPRGKEQLTVRLVPRGSQSFDLAVQWTCSPAVSKAMVEVREPKIVLNLEGPTELLFGQTKIYRLSMANPGNGDAENVVLLLAPVDGGSGAPTRHEIGLIRAGETKPVEVELSARQAGKLAIKATAVADGNLKSEVAQDILVRRAGLKTAVTGPELKFAGTPVTYNVVVSNPGNCTAENITTSAILPVGAKFINSPGAQYSEDENKVTWTIPSLRAGAEQEIQLTCSLGTPGQNRIQVLATAAGDLNDNISTVTNVEALADLKLEVADPPGPLAVGEEMVYEVHIRNRGSKAAENVDVAGFFSNGIEPISAQGSQNEIAPGQIIFHPIANIGPGSEVVLRIKARANQAGNHVFRTEVNCPSVGAKLASEETTLFYGDSRAPEERIAVRPAAAVGTQTVPPASENAAPAITR